MKAKKNLGQNFLIDENIIDKIINSFSANENDLIVEIGPGYGALTKKLKKYNANLLCFELDVDMKKYLNKIENSKTLVKYQDFLKTNLKNEVDNYSYNNLFVVGNLPYYITTPIIENLIKNDSVYKCITLMVQKEVADRFMAKPGCRNYGYFSLYLQYYFDIKPITFVSKNCFNPVPKVDSEVIQLIPYSKYFVKNQEKYFNFLQKAFKQKRKTLKNNIGNDFELVKPLLILLGYDINVRAESISQEHFIKLFELLSGN